VYTEVQAKRGPRRGRDAGGNENDCATQYSTDGTARQGWCRPRCDLYGYFIVDAFPVGCPLAERNPLMALTALRDRAFLRFCCDCGGGISDLDRAEACSACVYRLMRHPRVRRLRSLAMMGVRHA